MDNINYLNDWEDLECDDHPVLASFSNSNIYTKNNDWRTINNEIARGVTLRDSKDRKTQAQEYKIIDVYFNPRKKKIRNKSRRNSSDQGSFNPCKSKFCKVKSKSSKNSCPLRIEELALPSKRLCYDTYKYKSHILPAIMVQRLVEQIMDQKPKVKVSEAVEYFKRKRKIKNKKANMCKKLIIVDKLNHEDWNLNLLVGVLAYRTICKLMKPMNLILTPELQTLSYVVNRDIKNVLKNQKKKYIVKKNNNLQDEISKTVTMWIIEILHDADYKLKLDDLQDLETTYGHIFDIVDEVLESTMVICLPSDISDKSKTFSSEEFDQENENNETIEQNESDKITPSRDYIDSEHGQEHINVEIDGKNMKEQNEKDENGSLENKKSETKNVISDENYEEKQKIIPLEEKITNDNEVNKTVEQSITELQQPIENDTVESLENLNQAKNNEEFNKTKESHRPEANTLKTKKDINEEESNKIVNSSNELFLQLSESEKIKDIETLEKQNLGKNDGELKETKEVTSTESFKSIEEDNITTKEESNKMVDTPNTNSLQLGEIEKKDVIESLDQQNHVTGNEESNKIKDTSSGENLEREASSKGTGLRQTTGSNNLDSNDEIETNIFTDNNNTTEANNDVSDTFYIRDESLNSGSRNVTFQNKIDLGDKDELRDSMSSIESEKKWVQQVIASDQKLHEKSSKYNITLKNLASPNYNLLDSVDEKWPPDISRSRVNLIHSISRSIMSLGNLKEDEELQYYKKKPNILDMVSVDKIFPIEVDVDVVEKAIGDDNKNTEMKEVDLEIKINVTDFEKIEIKNLNEQTKNDLTSKTNKQTGTRHQNKNLTNNNTTTTGQTNDNQNKTEKFNLIDEQDALIEKLNIKSIPSVSEKKKFLAQDPTNKIELDKTTRLREFEYKLDPQTAPSWALKLIDRRKFKQKHLSKWYNNLEENLEKMSQWNDWLVNTCDGIISLKQSKCVRSKEKLRLWDELRHDMDTGIITWSNYFQIQKEKNNKNKNKIKILNGHSCTCNRSKKI